MTLDPVFFDEWQSRAAGEPRSQDRARALIKALELDAASTPVLSVVGSKGKGTTATYASAVLAAAGLRVVTITSPAFRSNRERIRVNGAAIDHSTYAALARHLDDARRALPDHTKESGYLAPSGLFTVAGALHAQHIHADALVIEAGMGGRSDEIFLFPPTIVAITEIFGEHLGILGDSIIEIAEEKAGIIAPRTQAVITAPQTPAVFNAIKDTADQYGTATLDMFTPWASSPTGPTSGPSAFPPSPAHDAPAFPPDLLPRGFSRLNALLGHAAALRLLTHLHLPPPEPSRLDSTLRTVRLPGRLSLHALAPSPPVGTATTHLLIDSAINEAGALSARGHALTQWPGIDHVLVCMPDHKDLDGVISALHGLSVTYVRLPYNRLRFTRPLPHNWQTIDAADLTVDHIASLGPHVLALGTVYFAGTLLDTINAPTEELFTPPRTTP
ncbi:dihydrofolate synthase / folylpolyglutamate synthase [Sinosporangium album]|uniref:Dihydrofolate synthase / folylpolyglutamate synthase n=1 Tax=Sinosporangium album TaxID=504805 RepID=A0A1G8JM41_9ACTN|nr:hypothetical protein [Sinosporangium album]SDI32067.1 dihydrofolate synthase / folylpolyglutamate synthase [Sinosporangium album]